MLFEGASLLAYTNKHLKENVDMTPPQSPSKKMSVPKVIPSPLKNFSPARKHQSPKNKEYSSHNLFSLSDDENDLNEPNQYKVLSQLPKLGNLPLTKSNHRPS